MAVNKSAAVAELGAWLKQIRTGAGLNVRQMGERIGVSAANVSNYETGARLIPLDRLTHILGEFRVAEDDREALLSLRRKADGPGELAVGASSIGPSLAQLIEHEEAACRITHWELGNIPGLAQTPEFARAVFGDVPDVNVLVTLRMGRAHILTKGSNPVEFSALIDSEVLVRPIVPPPVMAGQLRHLLDLQRRSNVEIRIVPSTVPGFHPGLHGTFKILEFPRASPVVYVENFQSSQRLWDDEYVRAYIEAAGEIEKRAMTPDLTSEAIEKMLRGLETT